MKNFFKHVIVYILTWEAKLLLRRTKPKIVAITGNVGKTTTKDAIYQVLSKHTRARKSEKSFNSELGVPLSVLGLSNAWHNPVLWIKNIFDGLIIALFPGDYPKVLVLEMGVDRPGDMAKHTEWIKPDIVVLTRLPNVPVHVEFFDSPEEVIAEKLVLVKALKPEGVLVYNHDDEKVKQAAEGIRQKSIGYSRYSPSQYSVTGDEVLYEDDMPTGLKFAITHAHDQADFELRGAIGVQHCYNFAAAAAVASQFDLSLLAAAEALKGYVPPPGRMRVIAGIKDSVLLDDSYNSSPVATERALSTLFELKGFKRKIAILGDMLELGQFSMREHERVGEQVAEGVDLLITVGVRARGIAESALEHGLSEKQILQFDESERAGRELQNLIEPGDVILVKGSESIRTEKIVLEVMAKPDESARLLVRQNKEWKAK